jgi:uncharacterized protein
LRFYLDTSLLVAAITAEEETRRTQRWLDERNADELLVSEWVAAEFSAALSIKLRSRQIRASERAAALAAFAGLCAGNLTVLPVEREHFRDAARFADQYTLGLRAGDALHLAVCADHGATLCTLDRRLSQAGPPLGVATLLL